MNTHSIQIRDVDDFLNNEVKDYALYVIKTRSLPSIMDGQRVGGRKILWAAMTGDLKRMAKDKMTSVIGDTMKLKFHHGDSSLKNTIEQLGAKHSFRYAPLRIIGQTPTLRSPETSTAARYLEVAKEQYLEWFSMDNELFDLNYEEGKYIEPKNLYPLVPIVLLWRTNSPGFGFSFRSFSFKLDDVIDATIMAVATGSCTGVNYVQLRPEIVGIKDENMIYNHNKDSWYNVGEYEIEGDTIKITQLPYNVTHSKYEDHLRSLEEQNYIIGWKEIANKDYKPGKQDNKKGKKVEKNGNYELKFAKGRLSVLLANGQFKVFTKLKLFTKIPKLTLNCIDTDGKSIVNFDTPNDLVDGFVKRRLRVYEQRKTRLLKVIQEEIDILLDRAKFVQLVIDEKLVINKRKIDDIKKDCDKFGVSYEGLKLAISRFTQDEIDKSMKQVNELKAQLEYIRVTTIQQMYIADLVEFKQKYCHITPCGINGPNVLKTKTGEIIEVI